MQIRIPWLTEAQDGLGSVQSKQSVLSGDLSRKSAKKASESDAIVVIVVRFELKIISLKYNGRGKLEKRHRGSKDG